MQDTHSKKEINFKFKFYSSSKKDHTFWRDFNTIKYLMVTGCKKLDLGGKAKKLTGIYRNT